MPDRLIPLGEVRQLLLQRRFDSQTKDAAWAELTRRAQSGSQQWILGAVGVMLPGLGRAARLIKADHRGDAGDIEADVIVGFVEALRASDPSMCALSTHLWRMAYQRALVGQRTPSRIAEWTRPGRPVPLVTKPGHPDLVLLRAVDDGVVSALDAEVVGRKRIEGTHLLVVAQDLGLSYADCEERLRRAEARLVDYLGCRR